MLSSALWPHEVCGLLAGAALWVHWSDLCSGARSALWSFASPGDVEQLECHPVGDLNGRSQRQQRCSEHFLIERELRHSCNPEKFQTSQRCQSVWTRRSAKRLFPHNLGLILTNNVHWLTVFYQSIIWETQHLSLFWIFEGSETANTSLNTFTDYI